MKLRDERSLDIERYLFSVFFFTYGGQRAISKQRYRKKNKNQISSSPSAHCSRLLNIDLFYYMPLWSILGFSLASGRPTLHEDTVETPELFYPNVISSHQYKYKFQLLLRCFCTNSSYKKACQNFSQVSRFSKISFGSAKKTDNCVNGNAFTTYF